MKLTVIAVGKAHDALFKDAIGEYEKRLSRYVSLDWKILPASDLPSESSAILKSIDERDYVILLDETGVMIDTIQLSKRLDDLANQSAKQVVIIIGGAFGVSESVKTRANFVWSLSPLVFPHQMVRLILAEQLYRAYDLLNGGKYHHV